MIIPEDAEPSPPKGQVPLPAASPAPPPAYNEHQPLNPAASMSTYNPTATIPIYVPASVLMPVRPAPPAGRRFLKAFAVALLVWALLGMVTKSIIEVARANWRHRTDGPEAHDAWPIKSDGRIIKCTKSPADWTHERDRALVSFDLPLSADVLYAFSRGVQSAGNIVITQDERTHDIDKVHVDVAAVHSTPHFLSSVSVCALERREGEFGIGVFTPSQYPRDGSRLPTLDFELTVRLPKYPNGSMLEVKSLETNLPQFAHHIGDLSGHVYFHDLNLRSSNAHITSHSVNATRLSVQTENSMIKGSYEASRSLELKTTNGELKAQVTVHNEDGTARSEVLLRNSNSPLTAYIELKSSAADKTGGAFHVVGKSSNGRLNLTCTEAPVDSKLELSAYTSNSAAYVTLHPTFEGKFQVSTKNANLNAVIDKHVKDPSGRDTTRQVEIWTFPTYSRGNIRWSGKHMGEVDVRTQNGPATLRG
ncbi:hypothetical protein NM688_g8139 [Phlebia brevispora]|uniref:Uncharacterized protein n=1 Tax=Phlebia brevispora TaxID=194682 RepID=A0ACC1RWT2_9APHY|nr:hypothetical protein NM688_g8139 [Phlebia brevispora]